jgi:hypothetical protein
MDRCFVEKNPIEIFLHREQLSSLGAFARSENLRVIAPSSRHR